MQCEARELQDWVGNGLSGYEESLWIDYLPELPRTATGTLQRFKLRELQRGAGVRSAPGEDAR
jgi:benzoate-CoA ligase